MDSAHRWAESNSLDASVGAEDERAELERRAKSRAGRADDARVARVLLLLADGTTYEQIQARVDCSAPFISKWKKRFLKDLSRRIMTHIRKHNEDPQPIKWKYDDPSRRIHAA